MHCKKSLMPADGNDKAEDSNGSSMGTKFDELFSSAVSGRRLLLLLGTQKNWGGKSIMI